MVSDAAPRSRPPLVAPWGEIQLEVDQPVARRIGPRDLWLHLRQGEIRLAHAKAEEGTEEPPAPPEEVSAWSRWALPARGNDASPVRVTLRPGLPERPLIVQPEVPFALLPRAQAHVYVRIPLTIRVEVARPTGEAVLLRTLPTLELSDTWWGDFIGGELCSWLTTTARRAVDASLLEPHLAICPLVMVNQSDADLKVEKLAFRVEHLSLFSDPPGFWADESRVRYQGEQEGSQIDMTGEAPKEATDPQRVLAPPVPARGIRALTFNRLLSLPGLGGS
jgi:hypothetical protein